jgi:hypothetical protein
MARLFTCKVCNQEKEARSHRGPLPRTCTDCKDKAKKAQLDELRAAHGRPPVYSTEVTTTGANASTVTWKIDTEPSWLDSPEVQEQLAEKNKADADASTDDRPDTWLPSDDETWVSPSTYETKPDDGWPTPDTEPTTGAPLGQPDYRICVAAGCDHPVAPGQAVDRFCPAHWRHLDLDLRGTLLGATPGTSVFEATMRKAIRSLR